MGQAPAMTTPSAAIAHIQLKTKLGTKPSRLFQKYTFGLGLGLGNELRNRTACNNESRQANRLASKYTPPRAPRPLSAPCRPSAAIVA